MDPSNARLVARALLDEQGALRRVATLVAHAGDPARMFPAVTEEVGRLLDAQTANMVRYRHDGTADVVGAWSVGGVPSVPAGLPLTLDSETLAPKIYPSGQAERLGGHTGGQKKVATRVPGPV